MDMDALEVATSDRVFLNLGFGRSLRDFRQSTNQPPCLWLSVLPLSFACFPSFFVKSTGLQNMGLALGFRDPKKEGSLRDPYGRPCVFR